MFRFKILKNQNNVEHIISCRYNKFLTLVTFKIIILFEIILEQIENWIKNVKFLELIGKLD